jgi:hypothetical protein
VDQAGWLSPALAALGLVAGLARGGAGRRAWFLIGVAGLANLAFALSYRVGDVEVFLLPVWLCAAIAAGGGLDFLRGIAEPRPWLAVTMSALLIALALPGVDGRGALVNRRNEHAAHDLALAMVAGDLAPGSRVVGLEGEMSAIRYMQAAHRRAAGVEVVVADDETLRRQRLEEAVAGGVPTYLTRELPGIAGEFSFGGEGALVRVWPRGEAPSRAPAQGVDAQMAGGALRLLGYDLSPLEGAAERTALLTLYWQPETQIAQNLKVSLRLLNADGTPWLQQDGTAYQQDTFPLRGVAPTTSWLPGEVVRDVYLVPNVAGTSIRVVVYDAESVAEVGTVDITPEP